jgi:hypothetical protein
MVTPDEQTIATLFNILLQAALSQSGNSNHSYFRPVAIRHYYALCQGEKYPGRFLSF